MKLSEMFKFLRFSFPFKMRGQRRKKKSLK